MYGYNGYGNSFGNGYPNPSFGNHGYGNPGYGTPMMNNFGTPPMSFSFNYRFHPQAIDTQGGALFFQCDFDRSGTLNIMEGMVAVNRFLQMNNLPPMPQNEFFMLFNYFDYDRSGTLDYGEFRMLLEQLGGIRSYTVPEIMSFRRMRNNRIHLYRSGCNMF